MNGPRGIAEHAVFNTAELRLRIWSHLLPSGQQYDVHGFDYITPAIPERPRTTRDQLRKELWATLLGQNHFHLHARHSIAKYNTVSNEREVREDDLEANVQRLRYMAKYQIRIDATLEYHHGPDDSLWLILPLFLPLVQLAHKYDMLFTVSGIRTQYHATNTNLSAQKGINILFGYATPQQRSLLLACLELGHTASAEGWSKIRLVSKFNALLDARRPIRPNPLAWKAVKRLSLGFHDTNAFLEPHNLLYETSLAAATAIRAVNTGQVPTLAFLSPAWIQRLLYVLRCRAHDLEKKLAREQTPETVFLRSLGRDWGAGVDLYRVKAHIATVAILYAEDAST
jgi:hypothetical protein